MNLPKITHFTAKICNFTAKNHKSNKNSKECFTESRVNLIYIEKKKYYKLVRGCAVEEQVDDIQEVRGAKPCKGGEKW